MEITPKQLKAIQVACRGFFKNDDGEPLELTDGQAEIFWSIYNPSIQRVQIMTTTQYGKSLTVALSALYTAKRRKAKVAIVAPTDKQGGIIMDYIISHLFDNEFFTKGLIDVTGIEKMRTQKTRDRLIWLDGAEIRVLTVGASNVTAKGLGVMGFHADIIIEDESSLIPDSHHSKVTRMLGGNVRKSKMVKIGNPFFRNHFYNSWHSDRFYKIFIDYKRAIAEGRLTEEFVEEQKTSGMSKEDFGVMYLVQFPDRVADDAVFEYDTVEKTKIAKDFKIDGWKIAGLDLSRGGADATVLTIFEIDDHNLRVLKQYENNETSDSIQVANWAIDLCIENGVGILGYDALGLGGAVGDYIMNLQEVKFDVVEYKAGNKAIDSNFANIKSQLAFTLRTWSERGQVDFSMCSGQMFVDLLGLNKKRASDRSLRVVDPQDSPDYLDSLLAGLFTVWGGNKVNITVL